MTVLERGYILTKLSFAIQFKLGLICEENVFLCRK